MPSRRAISSRLCLLLLLTFAMAILAGGCAAALPPEPEWEKNARVQIEQAETFYSHKQYEQASKTADQFFKLYPKSRYADRALRIKGEIALTKRDYRQALRSYQDLIERYPSSEYIADAKYKLGTCYFELGEYDLAIANLEDRTRITNPAQLKHISEMLSHAYLARKHYLMAVREYLYLLRVAENEKQRTGYRETIREIVDKDMGENDVRTLAAAAGYPSDIARLRLASLLVEQKKFREAMAVAKDFLERFPSHPEKGRAEALLGEATTKLATPRYYLGGLLPQTGPLAFFGDHIYKGIQLAVNTYNLTEPDDHVDLIAKDTEASPDKTVAALGELASKGVVAFIGPVTTKDEETITPLLAKVQIPAIRPAASRSGFAEKSPWIFRNALTIDSQAHAAARYALEQKVSRLVIFYPDEPYGKDLSTLFVGELERKAEIVATIAYPPETKDFGPYIKKARELDLRSRKIPIPEDEAARKKLFADYIPGFDGVYLPGYAERVGLLIPQLAFYNITGISMIGSDNWHSHDLIERAGRYAEGAVFVDGFFPESADPVIKTFVDAYRSAYLEEPDILSAQAYDAAMMVFSLLKQHKDTPIAVRDGLLNLKNYEGVSGLTTFDGSGEAQKKLFLIKVEGGKFTLVNDGK